MIEQAKLLSTTVVLTLLIWWSADSLVSESVTVGVTFDARPPAGSQDILVAVEGEVSLYQLEVSGPRKIIEEVHAKAPLRVRLRITDRPTGSHSIPLDRAAVKQAITDQWHDFRKVSVLSTEPSLLPVVVDHMITREVEIVARRLGLAFDVEPQLQRTTATVRMRESFLNTLSPGQALQIPIGPDLERILKEQPPGKSVTVPVPLDIRRFGPDATITPNSVEVTATVGAQRATAQIPTVPILFAMSSGNLERRCRAVTRDGDPLPLITQTITVTGQHDEVAKLQQGDTRAYGVIQLKEEDLETLGTLKLVTPEYRLPKGIDLANEPTPIEFKLIAVSNAEPPSGP